jgi:hypothetical protein
METLTWLPAPDAPKKGSAKKGPSRGGFLVKRGKAGTKAGPVLVAMTPPVPLPTPTPKKAAPAKKKASSSKLTDREQAIIDYARKKGSNINSKAAKLYGRMTSWVSITNKIDKDIAITKAVVSRKNAAIPFKLTQLTTSKKK